MIIGLIGAGSMGEALLTGLLQSDPAHTIEIVEADPARRSAIAAQFSRPAVSSIKELGAVDMVIIAVKPNDVETVCRELRSHSVPICVSIAAGISLARIADWSGKEPVRVMPNAPCLVGTGMSAIAFGDSIDKTAREQIESMFATFGDTVIVKESDLHAVTALSGSGPAYLYLVAETLIEAGCSHGLKRNLAQQLAFQTIAGAAALLKQEAAHPAVLRDQVSSPGGVTLQALRALEEHGMRNALWKAVDAAVERSQQLESQS